MRFTKILLVCFGLVLLGSSRTASVGDRLPKAAILADGGEPLPIPPGVADGGEPLPIPPVMADGGEPLPIPPGATGFAA